MPFPFSDLSGTKLRPALIVADVGRGDWVLCQITSNRYADVGAVRVTNGELSKGSLRSESFVRPMKLFTANQSIVTRRVAILNDETFRAVLESIIARLTENMP